MWLTVLLLSIYVSVSESSFSITVETDKPHYQSEEHVSVYGNLTYKGWPVCSQLIAIKVRDPQNDTVLIRTRQTDLNGAYNLTFRLSPEASLGTYMVEVSHEAAQNHTTFEVFQLLGDINKDCVVNLKDVYVVALAFGSSPGHPNWNAACDINRNNKVDLTDYSIVCSNYGKKYP